MILSPRGFQNHDSTFPGVDQTVLKSGFIPLSSTSTSCPSLGKRRVRTDLAYRPPSPRRQAGERCWPDPRGICFGPIRRARSGLAFRERTLVRVALRVSQAMPRLPSASGCGGRNRPEQQATSCWHPVGQGFHRDPDAECCPLALVSPAVAQGPPLGRGRSVRRDSRGCRGSPRCDNTSRTAFRDKSVSRDCGCCNLMRQQSCSLLTLAQVRV